MNDFWKTVLSSAGFSVVACAFLGWLFREWISARLHKSIQHEYDKKLVDYETKVQHEYDKKFTDYETKVQHEYDKKFTDYETKVQHEYDKKFTDYETRVQHEYDERLEDFKSRIQFEYNLKLESSKTDFQKVLDERQTRFKYWHDEKAKAIKELYTDACDLYFSLLSLYLFDRKNKKVTLNEEQRKKRKDMKNEISSNILSVVKKWYGLRIFLDNDEDKAFKSFGMKANNWSKLFSDKQTEELFEKENKIHSEIKDTIEKLRESFREALCVDSLDSQKQDDCVQEPINQNEPSEQKPSTE